MSSSSLEIYRLFETSKRRRCLFVYFDYFSPSVKTNRPIDCESSLPFEGISKFPAQCSTRFFLRRSERSNYNILHRSFSVHRKIINLDLFFPFPKGEKKIIDISISARTTTFGVPRQRSWLSEPTRVIEREGFVARCCHYAAAGYRNISLASPSCVGHWPLGCLRVFKHGLSYAVHPCIRPISRSITIIARLPLQPSKGNFSFKISLA